MIGGQGIERSAIPINPWCTNQLRCELPAQRKEWAIRVREWSPTRDVGLIASLNQPAPSGRNADEGLSGGVSSKVKAPARLMEQVPPAKCAVKGVGRRLDGNRSKLS